jgi:chitinase
LIYQKKASAVPKGDASDARSVANDVCGQTSRAAAAFSGIWTYETMVSGGILSKDGSAGLKGYKRYYDKCSQTPFLFNSKARYLCVGSRCVICWSDLSGSISYDDQQSLTQKARLARAKGLAGVVVFHSKGLTANQYKAMKKNL